MFRLFRYETVTIPICSPQSLQTIPSPLLIIVGLVSSCWQFSGAWLCLGQYLGARTPLDAHSRQNLLFFAVSIFSSFLVIGFQLANPAPYFAISLNAGLGMSSSNAVLSLPSMANPANVAREASTAPFQPSPVGPHSPQARKNPASGASGACGACGAV